MAVSHHVFLFVEWFCVALCIIVVGARLVVRTRRRMWSLWMSEAFLVIALLLFMTLVVGDTATFLTGDDSFGLEWEPALAKWKFAATLFFDLGFYFPRFSLLAFYNELFPISEFRLRRCLYFVMLFNVCGLITTCFVDVFWCGPNVAQNWNDPNATCTLATSPTPMYIAWPISITSELLVFLLPFPLLKRLTIITKRERTGLACIFALGILTISTSVIRFAFTVKSILALQTYLIAVCEIATQIIVVALPALRPLLGRKVSSSRGEDSAHGSDSSNKRILPGSQNTASISADDASRFQCVEMEMGQDASSSQARGAQEPWERIVLPRPLP